ncbi:hypothetical protein CYQ91_02725 [Vibrio diabolicus]|uniref:Uncharacterized protein n=1 Tax=Vibrio diabolicus TaxID=50719 RepID=A0AAX1XS59_9VIBR|nr:hypothetical protein CYQ91_02725 [Vibrio diabolicus]
MLVASEYPTLLMSDRGKSAGIKNRKTMLVAFLFVISISIALLCSRIKGQVVKRLDVSTE